MDIYDVTASALTAQRLRLDTIASNLANVNTTRKPDGTLGAYHRKNVVFAPFLQEANQQIIKGRSGLDIPSSHLSSETGGSQLSIGPNGKPFFKLSATYQDAGTAPMQGVQVQQIAEDNKTPMHLVYDPSHPDANEKGYVEMPNINVVTEMVDMISATRAYEANVTALQSAKSMSKAALDI